jgi:hypothetical protein
VRAANGGGAAVTAGEFRLELVTQPVPPPGADPELDEVEASAA